ncbi:MAG: hypothetical protein WCJ87_14095 [Burkholderiales bacterium]
MESNLPETGFVTERLEDLTVELSPQIHFAFKTIGEPQPQRMASAVLSGDEARKHGGHSKGQLCLSLRHFIIYAASSTA